MNKRNKGPNFFEPKTIIAFTLTVLVFVFWQDYMSKKYPHKYGKVQNANKVAPLDSQDTKGFEGESSQLKTSKSSDKKEIPSITNKPEKEKISEKILVYETESWKVSINNHGMEIKDLVIKGYKNRAFENVKMSSLFKTSFLNESEGIPFEIQQTGERTFEGKYSTAKGSIFKILKFGKTPYTIHVDYKVDGLFNGISTYISLFIDEDIKSSIFSPTFERQEYVVFHPGGEDRDMFELNDFSNKFFGQAQIVSLGSQFFTRTIVDDSTLKPNALVYVDAPHKTAIAKMEYIFSPEIKSFEIRQTYFAGPKDEIILNKVNENLPRLVDFGIFNIICTPMLKLLRFFYGIFSNYGVAIIFLTLIMRMLVFPIAHRGYKSMSKMQKVQPILKSIREKHKDDPQKANVEIMGVMKEHGVNPIGGCLPMLLQLPIFFAFYRVLSESIVMYQAPFFWWIQDLSLKDPYYILPLSMGGIMFVQQKLTPTSMEPMQQKVMLALPIVFSFFMMSLPSALTLYIFVSTLFGVLQQYLFMRDNKT